MSLRNFKFAKSLNETSIKGNNQEFPTNGISDNEHNEKCHQNIFQRIFYVSILYVLHALFISMRNITLFISLMQYSISINYKMKKTMLQNLINNRVMN